MAAVTESNGLMTVTAEGSFSESTLTLAGELTYTPYAPGKGTLRVKIGTCEHTFKMKDLTTGQVLVTEAGASEEPTYNESTGKIETSAYANYNSLVIEIEASGKSDCKVACGEAGFKFKGSGQGSGEQTVTSWLPAVGGDPGAASL